MIERKNMPKSSDTAPTDVVESAQAWLALLDSSSYSSAWEQTAASMHACISQADFEKGMQSDRAPWGTVKSRKIKIQRHITRRPQWPETWIMSYTTTFEKNPNVIETIVLGLEPDGKWRVAGYTLP
jgi:hypothetical protein